MRIQSSHAHNDCVLELQAMQAAGQKAIDQTPGAAEQESLEQLTHRAKVLIAKADNQMISAGQVLKEIKARVTDKSSEEGKPWRWSWRRYLSETKLCIGKDGRQIQRRQVDRLIQYVSDPEVGDQQRARDRERKQTAKESGSEFRPAFKPAKDRPLATRKVDCRNGAIDGKADEQLADIAPAAASEAEPRSHPHDDDVDRPVAVGDGDEVTEPGTAETDHDHAHEAIAETLGAEIERTRPAVHQQRDAAPPADPSPTADELRGELMVLLFRFCEIASDDDLLLFQAHVRSTVNGCIETRRRDTEFATRRKDSFTRPNFADEPRDPREAQQSPIGGPSDDAAENGDATGEAGDSGQEHETEGVSEGGGTILDEGHSMVVDTRPRGEVDGPGKAHQDLNSSAGTDLESPRVIRNETITSSIPTDLEKNEERRVLNYILENPAAYIGAKFGCRPRYSNPMLGQDEALDFARQLHEAPDRDHAERLLAAKCAPA